MLLELPNVGGSNNTLTVKGTCASVNIGGADNKVTFEKVDKDISVVGFNNTIDYRDGDPKVSDLGSGNKITEGPDQPGMVGGTQMSKILSIVGSSWQLVTGGVP